MREDSRNLWDHVYRLLAHHQKPRDASPNDVLNRLFHEYRKDAKTVLLSQDNCGIGLHSCTTEELDAVERRHSRADPKQEQDAVVVLSYEGKQYLIDGNNRANKWVGERHQGSHSVLLITYTAAK